jgi:hypothetical protein
VNAPTCTVNRTSPVDATAAAATTGVGLVAAAVTTGVGLVVSAGFVSGLAAPRAGGGVEGRGAVSS